MLVPSIQGRSICSALLWTMLAGASPVSAGITVSNEGGATAVTDAGATVNGVLGGGAADVTLYWGETDGGNKAADWINKIDLGRKNPGKLSAELTKLSDIRFYFYRYSARDGQTEVWAPATTSFRSSAKVRSWDPTTPHDLPDIVSRITGYDEKNVHLQKEGREVVKFPIGRLHASDLAYLRAFRCQMPVMRSGLNFKGQVIIDLQALDLPLGPLLKWENKGELPCSFLSLNSTHPDVVMHDGRKAVHFTQGRATVGQEFTVMMADVSVPRCLIDNSGFSASFWVWNEEPLASHNIFFALKNLDLKGYDFNYSKHEKVWNRTFASLSAATTPAPGTGLHSPRRRRVISRT